MSLSVHASAPPSVALRFPVALRMAMVVALLVWANLLCMLLPWHLAYAVFACLQSWCILGSAAVAVALVVTGLARRTPLSAFRGLSIAWYAVAVGWIPLLMVGVVPVLLVLGIPGLLAAELYARSRRRRGALGG